MQKIKVIGVGPGGPRHLTPEAKEAMRGAGLIIGGERHLKTFAVEARDKLALKSNFQEMLEKIILRRESGVVVLASGDPGMYGILRFLLKHFDPGDIEVVPGISSVQLAFARLSMPWDDAVMLSAHGRPAEKVAELARGAGKAAILTGTGGTPEKIFKLINQGPEKKVFYFCYDLGLPGEDVVRLSSGEIFPEEYRDRQNCVMVVLDE